ncbi:MAG: protein kinase domain-containing protein [Pyrinomonadaceae bacterium]
MKTQEWKKVNQIVLDALELDGNQRRELIEDSCRDMPELRFEVESLLAGESGAEEFFGAPAISNYYAFFDQETEPDMLVGEKFGVYEVIRELGYGGMGAVFLAERTDGKFEQKVALKLLKREMNTAALRRRFQQERNILASLEHPHIARLLDAGTTDDKVPYIAMEYVEGLPIDDYCNTNHLDLNQRLDLFREVCSVVNFAHRNLIVHRDLKPSNILVTKDGTPKLLDFGISKILSDQIENIGSATVTKLGVMTPGYASPEQLQSKSVTTATDIYSLGIILYELLSGHRPFEGKENDLKEIYKAVIEIDPPLPSAMIEIASKQFRKITEAKTAIKYQEFPKSFLDESFDRQDGNSKTEANKIFHTKPQTINLSSQLVRGDLDNIILKALRKEPERRYSSAENFSEDIKRYLRGLPVSAHPNTFSYRAEKFFKRNKASVFAGLLILIAIIGGIAATLWQTSVAQVERAKAEKRFNDVRTLANSFLFEFSPKIENLPGSMPARELLVTRALEYLDNLSQEAADDLDLQNELAKAYEKVGDVQGNPQTPNIGDLKGALASYEKAQTIRRKLLELNPDNAEKQAALAGNLEVVSNINLNGGEFNKAETGFNEAVALREKVLTSAPQDFTARSNLANALRVSGFVPFYNSENEKAMEFYRRSLAMFSELSAENPSDAFVNMQHANLYLDIGENFSYMDDMAQAQENVQKGMEMLAAVYEKNPNNSRVRRAYFVSLLKRGELYRDDGDVKNSLDRYDRSVELAQTALQNEPGSFQAKRDVMLANKQRAVTLKAANRIKESIEGFAKAIEVSEQLRREDPSNILIAYDLSSSYQDMGEMYYDLGDYNAARNAAEKAQENCGEVLAKNPSHTQAKIVTARAKNMLGKSYLSLAEKNGQDDLRQKALENLRASLKIYDGLKAEGKTSAIENKKIEELKVVISKAESKINE